MSGTKTALEHRRSRVCATSLRSIRMLCVQRGVTTRDGSAYEARKSGGAYVLPHSRPPQTSLTRYISVYRLPGWGATAVATVAEGTASHAIGDEKSDHSTSVPMPVPAFACARTLNHQDFVTSSPANDTAAVAVVVEASGVCTADASLSPTSTS